ncbi:glucokinase [Roseiarcus fermentans]|uniref:Glucokinase n=1 Tax=Roseiarcus fermentans TaxID=1473586 RepID=A0A366ENP7_9HYPH|nr:glucokinase [Roseiarcus fermentans]RBP04042.1 glucokinase [Roseiarcus fermentans]
MTAFSFPFPALVCDTGGTNVRFALSPAPGAPLGPIVHLVTDDYPGLPEAIEAAAPKLGARARSMIVCGAGPVVGRELKLTNAPWVMDGPETARRAGLEQGLLLNDFEAQALSLPAIEGDWTRPIGPVAFGGPGPQVILGPGTGLGIAALVEAEGRFTPVSSEACHISFGPVTEEEFALWPHLERAHGRITSESVLNGSGLARVHRARMVALGRPDPHLEPPQVTAAALADPNGEVADSVRLYWRIMARFAGDMAVTFVATGGVTLSGGVLPRLVDFLDDAAFRTTFEDKAPVDALAKRIATRLIVRSDAVLAGMAAIAAAPDRYGVDYAARGWV